MHTHARESPLSLEKIHLPHYELQTKCCNAANFYNMLSQGMPARKSRNRALGWRETLNNALHTSQHTELDDNMKEHLNRTACGFFSSNCSTPSRQQHCSDDPIMSCFLLVRLLMNHQGKHFPARRMQESGSCTARRLPLEESLWSSSGRKGECSMSGACACQHPQGFIGAEPALQAKTEPMPFLSAEGTEGSAAAAYGKAFKPFIPTAPDLLFQDSCHSAARFCW